ncbi:MAG: hypothetical protein IPL23_20370 [Saprospiraceae bacterium]|nr:hypothetical protein [Saprospiraceae bacterium]
MKLTSIQQQFTKAFKIGSTLFLTAIAICLLHFESTAQATLSIQGILKKSNGVALDDGVYKLTFRIYPAGSPPSTSGALWTEEIPDVDLNGGIYSVILGKITPLGLTFSDVYELGVQVESSPEMSPRLELTSAPYALALRGTTNQFPSSGLVLADNLRVAEGVLARAGAPGLSGVNKNGYGMIGNNDTGVFSTAYGKVSLFASNVETLEATPSGITIFGAAEVNGHVGSNSLNLYNNTGINYSTSQGSFKDWRLVDVDDISTLDGWQQYGDNNGSLGWTSSNASNPCTCGEEGSASGVFLNPFLMVSDRNNVLKKQFNIAGNYTQIKVKFRYVAIDSWDVNQDYGFAGFASDVSGTNFKVAWYENLTNMLASPKLHNAVGTSQFRGNVNLPDFWREVEITGRRNGNSNTFWVFIGAAMEGDLDELFGAGPFEVWVK